MSETVIATPWHPQTCREVAASFSPLHAWHTMLSVERGVRAVVLTCDCGTRRTILESDVETAGWSWTRIKAVLAILPETPAIGATP